MTISSEGITPFETGAGPGTTPNYSRSRTIDRRLVHKSYDQNVLISHIETVTGPAEPEHTADSPSDRIDHFHGILCVHKDHPFFFEHERSHIPGLYLIEATRQMVIAIAHLFYKVPFDIEFVMTKCSADFHNVANLDDPLLAEERMSGHVYRKGRLTSMHSDILIRQRNLEVARLTGTIILLKKHQLQYLEQRGAPNG
jgi:hypothetical protein